MRFEVKLPGWGSLAAAAIAFSAAPALHAQTAIEVPGIVQHSIDHGSISPVKQSTVTVHLKSQNEAAFDKAVQELYTAGSPTYHQWMTDAELAKYAPTKSQFEVIVNELRANGLAIVDQDSNRYWVRARGTALNLEHAFQTQLHAVEYQGKTIQANVAPASLRGEAGSLVKGVTGLTEINLKPDMVYPINPATGKRTKTYPAKLASSSTLSNLFTNNCFGSPTTLTLTTSGAALPVGVYYGTRYLLGTKVCGWTPSQAQVNYGMQNAYNRGLTGKGQTIVLVEGPVVADNILSDAQAFAGLTGLPPFTSSNFKVIYPDGVPSTLALENESFDGEAQLDVEWAHAFAPGANIVMLITPTTDWTEFEFAIQYAASHKLGNVVSNSYGYPEGLFGAYTVSGFEQVLKTAAAAGVAVNFSSGDSGDVGFPNAGGASYPAASAYTTSIGGTSIGLPGPSGYIMTGWGNNLALLSYSFTDVLNPPLGLGFYAGSGGGESVFITKPSWQSALSGSGRQQPDISAVADPYTGVVIVADGQIGAIGGTSASCPIFSAIWAIADQEAGKSLGQAAPLIYSSLGKNTAAVQDITPYAGPTNVSGTIYDSSGQTFYSAASLLAPLQGTTQFLSSFWDASCSGAGPGCTPSGEIVDLSFGTDSSLKVTTGWDNVTGWGSPRGTHFIDAAAALK